MPSSCCARREGTPRAFRLPDTRTTAVLAGHAALARSATGTSVALVVLADGCRRWVQAAAGAPAGRALPLDGSFCECTLRGDAVFEVEDARGDPRFTAALASAGVAAAVHYAGAPITLPDGQRVGTLCVLDTAPGRLGDAQRLLLTQLARTTADVLAMGAGGEDPVADDVVAKNRMLESVIENLPCGVTVFDRELRHLASNAQARRMLDLPDGVLDAPDASFQSVARYLAERGEYGPGDVDQIVAARMTIHPVSHLRERVRADGTVVQIRAGSLPCGGLVTTYTDVTEQRRAVAELTTSQRRLSRAIEASSLGLWEYDTARREYQFSEGWSRLLSLPHVPPTLGADEIGSFMPSPELPRLRDLQMQLVQGELDRLDVEHSVAAADGGTVWLHTMAQVSERDASGRALRIVGACQDVTARRNAEAALHAALETAGQASRAKSDFLATMSHEIRTPINGVIGLAHLLAGADLPETESGYVRMIGSCAKSLLSLVDNILDFSKIEAGRMQLQQGEADLRQMLAEIADVFAVRAAEKDIRFQATIAPEVPAWILGDAARLRQILLNLLGNALKFTSAGAFALEVRVRAGKVGETLSFAVRDSGIGISQVDQARLFTRFTQSDGSASRKYPGTGLGLAISRQLAQLMGGDITLVSWPGLGSTFTLAIPLRRAAAPQPQDLAASPQRAAPHGAALLLVEDNPVNQMVARGLLASLGYTRVTLAGNGLEAVEACERAAFDLVLMDCQMPEMDGLRATRILRHRGVATPIVALTASAVTGDRERCIEAGMDDYLTKPIEPALLAEKLQRWLGVRAADAAQPHRARRTEDASSAAFDPSTLQERFFNETKLFEECRRIFVRQTPAWIEELQGCFETGDRARARHLAHSVKGSAATIGAQRLADCCMRIERAVDDGGEGLAAAAGWLAQLRPAFAGFVEASAGIVQSAAMREALPEGTLH